jgi:hypothetical protein
MDEFEREHVDYSDLVTNASQPANDVAPPASNAEVAGGKARRRSGSKSKKSKKARSRSRSRSKSRKSKKH